MPTAFSTFSIFDPEDFLSSRTSENGQSPSFSRAYLHSTRKFRRVTVLKYGNVCRKVRLIAFGNSCAPEEIYAAVVNAAERKGCCVRGLEINEEKGFVSRACSAYANQEATQTSPELISPLFFLALHYSRCQPNVRDHSPSFIKIFCWSKVNTHLQRRMLSIPINSGTLLRNKFMYIRPSFHRGIPNFSFRNAHYRMR